MSMGSPAISSCHDNLLLSTFCFYLSSGFSPFFDWRTYWKCSSYPLTSRVTVFVSRISGAPSSILAPWLDATLMFWDGTTLRKWAFALDEGAIVILELLFETSGAPKRFTSSFPSIIPATILVVLLGNWTARAPCCLLATTPRVSMSNLLPFPRSCHFFLSLSKTARAPCWSSWDASAGEASSRSIWTGSASWRAYHELGKRDYPLVALRARFLRTRCRGMDSYCWLFWLVTDEGAILGERYVGLYLRPYCYLMK